MTLRGRFIIGGKRRSMMGRTGWDTGRVRATRAVVRNLRSLGYTHIRIEQPDGTTSEHRIEEAL